MKNVAIISDSESFLKKHAVLEALADYNCKLFDLGVFSRDEEYSYVELVTRVAETLQRRECDICIGLSLSGNGLQIDANKFDNIRAAPCASVVEAQEAASSVDANMLDIYSGLPEEYVVEIAKSFVSGSRN